MFPFRICLYVFLLFSSVVVSITQDNSPPSPYLTPATVFHRNYQNMVQNFKVFMYEPNTAQFNFGTEAESLFYSSLQNSSYLTRDAEEAHLFFLPFSPNISTRSLARVIAQIRNDFPYWNRNLGADHFYLSCDGIPRKADRNLVELKKNAVQVSCFPTRRDRFVPHKDLTLPPLADSHAPGRLGSGNFCVVEYDNIDDDDVLLVEEALRLGCVPVVVAEGPVNDMPFMDVLRWREIAVFVKSGDKGSKGVAVDTDSGNWRERHVVMKGLGVAASKHLRWNSPPLPLDAFNTIMYQLWLRRHTIRYATASVQ